VEEQKSKAQAAAGDYQAKVDDKIASASDTADKAAKQTSSWWGSR